MARISGPQPSGFTILIVDDQAEVLVSLRQLLEREGHRVLTAEGGEAALALLAANDVHLVLVDFFMPRMSGDVLVRAIRARNRLVQIILQTAYSGEKPARDMLAELDIQAYHDKAAGPEKLLVWIDTALKGYSMLSSLLERDRVFSELRANVSHEMRTPLNIVGGYADLLLDDAYGPLPAAARPVLDSIGSATQALSEITNEFLDHAGRAVVPAIASPEPIDLYALMRQVGQRGALLVDEKKVAFRVESTALPPTLVAEAGTLRAIVGVLVNNAARFTARGEIVVRLSGDGDWVRFVIADTGPGIAAADLDRIFEPFRPDETPDLTGGGRRSLALARKLARLLSGDLTVESTVGRGSVFTLRVPRRADAAARDSGAAAPAALG